MSTQLSLRLPPLQVSASRPHTWGFPDLEPLRPVPPLVRQMTVDKSFIFSVLVSLIRRRETRSSKK